MFYLGNSSSQICGQMVILFTFQEMGLLEVKHGLLQIAESLDFLHNNARLIHRAISPEVTTVYLIIFFVNNFPVKW